MRYTFIILFLFKIGVSFSQTGGGQAFPFLDLSYNARLSSLGRDFITVRDGDLNMGIHTPSLINEKMLHKIGFNQFLLAGGINHGMLSYCTNFGKIGIGSMHLRYVAYGQMERTDINGESIGSFYAGDFIIGSGVSRQLNERISIGGNLNAIFSQLESYNSFGFSIDFSGTYESENKRTVISTLVRNIGYQIKSYTSSNRYPLRPNALIGISHKLEYAPFRFGMVAHHLNLWDLTYFDPTLKETTDPLTGEVVPVPVAGFGEKVARHFLYQIELLAGKSVHLRMAFDYQRRREMLVDQRPGMGGFSFGVGLYFKRFSLDYGLSIFSSAGFQNGISLTTNPSQWKK